MLSSEANVRNSKLLQALYAFDSPVLLTETLGLSGEFFSYDKGGTAFLGLLDPGLNSQLCTFMESTYGLWLLFTYFD